MSVKSGILNVKQKPHWSGKLYPGRVQGKRAFIRGSEMHPHPHPPAMDDTSTASDIKNRKKNMWPIPKMAFLSTVVAAIASLCIKACPFLGLGNHVGKLAKWHSHPNRETGSEPGDFTGSKEGRASVVVRKMRAWWVPAYRDPLLVLWSWTRKSTH